MLLVEIFTEGRAALPINKIPEKFFHSLTLHVLEYMRQENVSVNIILTDNDLIQKINAEYRGKDYPTDVISFAYRDDMFPAVEDITEELGDIYISIEKAAEQAVEFETTLKDEFKRLIIHGVLHLLGYDHELSDEDERVMNDLEEKIFNEIET